MSSFTWIDHSEKQRRQILEAIDQFREKDTRDELGLAGIRDTFSDMLFPGTGSLQTRARYFFFVPWMYQGFEVARVSSAEVARKGRSFELALIDRHPLPRPWRGGGHAVTRTARSSSTAMGSRSAAGAPRGARPARRPGCRPASSTIAGALPRAT